MSARDALAALARGERPEAGLLHSCRFEGFGAESYGEEAIVEQFRAADFALSDDAIAVGSAGHVAIFAVDRALFADVGEGGVTRLWALSDAQIAVPEHGLSVAFDPDMAQARGDLFIAASDHPELDVPGALRVTEIGCAIARDDPGYRTRAFAIRAFGTDTRGAALFAIYRLEGGAERVSSFACAGACWSEGDVLVVHDRAGRAGAVGAPWTPRIGA